MWCLRDTTHFGIGFSKGPRAKRCSVIARSVACHEVSGNRAMSRLATRRLPAKSRTKRPHQEKNKECPRRAKRPAPRTPARRSIGPCLFDPRRNPRGAKAPRQDWRSGRDQSQQNLGRRSRRHIWQTNFLWLHWLAHPPPSPNPVKFARRFL